MNSQKTTDQPIDPWLAKRAPDRTITQIYGRNRRNNPLSGVVITKITTNMGGTEGTSDQETTC